ncbi:sensor histidine kinase, partial [Dysgonomonas sp. ZJ709]|uniref:sensor histidine kinase n=1 Tax=Dysgonomonas sp. ZJ709 TaxID=2709797 RepID=UPI00162AA873
HIPPIYNVARFTKDFFDNSLIGILIVGLGAAAKLIKSWINEQSIRSELEKEQLKTNLNLLKNQVSPHFFMNTLNNIHALIDIDSEKAKDSIILLSTMMRYLLYDSSHDKISLSKEIEFIESYIALMKLRHNEKVRVELNFPDNAGEIKIPPMLFASFIENAFKYGVSYKEDSAFYFEIKIDNDLLIFKGINGINKTNRLSDYGGLGIVNTRQTLDLLYGNNYKLTVNESDKFEVELIIPL